MAVVELMTQISSFCSCVIMHNISKDRKLIASYLLFIWELCDKEGKLRQCQVGERGSPETMPCSAEEPANASRTRNISLSEFKESLQTVGKMDQAWTRMEPRVGEFQFSLSVLQNHENIIKC